MGGEEKMILKNVIASNKKEAIKKSPKEMTYVKCLIYPYANFKGVYLFRLKKS